MSADQWQVQLSPDTHHNTVDADALTARVYELDGVTDVFPPAAIVTQVPQLVVAVVSSSPEKLNRVDVSSTGSMTRITARIGTSRDLPTLESAQSVADTLLAGVAEGEPVTVTVQVSRIS